MPQYTLKMPQGANTDAQSSNGTQPNQRFWKKNLHKQRNPNMFSKNPNFWTV